MTRIRIIGLIGALLGVAIVIYSLSRTIRIGAGGSSGVGAIGPLDICPGVMLITAGLTALVAGKPRLK
jgi:hypothetical protein